MPRLGDDIANFNTP